MKKFTLHVLVVALIFGAADAASATVIPNGVAVVEGNALTPLSSSVSSRTYQMTIDAGQLSGLVGQDFLGLQWRLDGPQIRRSGIDGV